MRWARDADGSHHGAGRVANRGRNDTNARLVLLIFDRKSAPAWAGADPQNADGERKSEVRS